MIRTTVLALALALLLGGSVRAAPAPDVIGTTLQPGQAVTIYCLGDAVSMIPRGKLIVDVVCTRELRALPGAVYFPVAGGD